MKHLLSCALVAAIAAGCGSSSSHPPDGPPLDAALLDAHVNLADVTGTVDDQLSGNPIADATVCLTGLTPTPCATSAPDGTYTLHLAVPDGQTLVASVTSAATYLGRENTFTEDPTPENDYEVSYESIGGLYPAADATALLATQAGFTYPTTTNGFVQLRVFGATATDHPTATATISPAPPGSGPVYCDPSDAPDPSLTTTSTSGQLYFGNLPPATYAITVQSPGRTCSIEAAGGHGTINGEWPPTGGETLRVGISANAMSDGIVVDCI